MHRDRRSMAWMIAAAAGGVLLLLLIIRPFGGSARNPRGPEFPPELADAIRDGIAMTREARRDAIDGMASANRWRLLAIVIGASIPVVISYLALRLAATKDPDEADVMARMIEESDIIAKRSLRDIKRGKLKDSKNLSEGEDEDDDAHESPVDETEDNR